MKRFTLNTSVAVALGLGLALTVLWLMICDRTGDSTPIARAASYTVCPEGPPTCDYATIQAAVDAANDGNVIKVATGVYTDVHMRPRNDVTTTGVVTQVIYITKSVTIQSGYTTTAWTIPYPITQPTVLDAQGQERVVYITGDISPTIEGLQITGGNASNLGGSPNLVDGGGGVYIITATATLSNNWVFSNTATWSGGLAVVFSSAILRSKVVASNIAYSRGGGIVLVGGSTVLSNNWYARAISESLFNKSPRRLDAAPTQRQPVHIWR
jgi:hypothetical protein